jgi:hypothetical protein
MEKEFDKYQFSAEAIFPENNNRRILLKSFADVGWGTLKG